MKILIIILFTLSVFNSIRAQWRVMPTISVSQDLSIIGGYISSETATNYKNGYIDYNDFIFTVEPTVYLYQYTQFPNGSTSESTTYKSKFYQSMLLASIFYAGCNIKIIKNLNLNLSIGYALSLTKYKYVVWQDYHNSGDPAIYGFHNAFERSPVQILAMRSITGQLGLNYTFSFEKKEKQTK